MGYQSVWDEATQSWKYEWIDEIQAFPNYGPSTSLEGYGELPPYSPPKTPTSTSGNKTVVRTYPQRNPDGSIAEVTQWSDGSYTEKDVQPAGTPPAPTPIS